MCQYVQFKHEDASISSVLVWRRFVLCDIVEALCRFKALHSIFHGSHIRYSRTDEASNEPHPLRLRSSDIKQGTSAQYALTRLLPIPIHGNLPLNFILPLYPYTAIGNIALWKERNETKVFSFSLQDFFLNSWFGVCVEGM